MSFFQRMYRWSGWITFAITAVVFFFSVERTGSLWDCGEFISAAYKLQVVHPPGAPLFILIGRMFTWVAEMISDDPSAIGHAVNLMSGLATAFAAGFVAWTTILLSKMSIVGRNEEPDQGQTIAIGIAGLVAGCTAAFATSVWFSAVEGEVYALSTFFTALTIWSTVKWYSLPKDPQYDRWLIFAIFAAGLSSGVHLLSLLTFPALALFYYYKKFEKKKLLGGLIAMGVGVLLIGIIQSIVIVGIPKLWFFFDRIMVNGFGLPANSGIIPTVLVIAAVIGFGLRYSHLKRKALLHQALLAFMFVVIGYSTIGVVVIRSNANPPINMNEPSDPSRLIPYINREQYGERPLLFGPHYKANPVSYNREDRLGLVDGEYIKVSEKMTPVYRSSDEMFFPRLGHMDDRRRQLYNMWLDKERGKPTLADNFKFFFQYQIGWMYYRYFMWNVTGRQNAEQGFFPWMLKSGHWESGVEFLDERRLYNKDYLPKDMAKEQSKNHYYFLPLIFGLIGLFWQYKKRRKDFFTLFTLFIITGLGIIVYSNQPPNEPRERDYVLAGSFLTFAMWVGMAVPALYSMIRERSSLSPKLAAITGGVLVAFAPAIMLAENFDDHSRRYITAARDYANNYLQSLDENAIIFTYGDNDTYPLWYAQEVENIRPDVRIINLSLIAVDWYINQMRRKVNESPPLNMTVKPEAIRGDRLNAIRLGDQYSNRIQVQNMLRELNANIPLSPSTSFPKKYFLDIDKNKFKESKLLSDELESSIISEIPIDFSGNMITKDDIAVLDIISSNIHDRPIYFASTVQPSKLLGMNDYMQMEGLALRLIPVKSNSQSNLGIYGSGRVAAEKILETMENEYQWGGFEKRDLFVDESYSAAVQAHRMAMLRSAQKFLSANETGKAARIADLYFHGFPNMNFPYIKHQVEPFISAYIEDEQLDKAKRELNVLVDQIEEYTIFFDSIDPQVLSSSFSRDQQLLQRSLNRAKSLANDIGGDYGERITERLNQL